MIIPYEHNGDKYAIFEGYWSRQDVSDNPDMLFVFGDNLLRRGMGGQAIVRDYPNAIGLVTKNEPTNAEHAFFSDHQYGVNIHYINDDIKRIKAIAQMNKMTLVFAAGGYGTGLAMLDKTAPRTFVYLCQRMLEEFGFDNVAALELYK